MLNDNQTDRLKAEIREQKETVANKLKDLPWEYRKGYLCAMSYVEGVISVLDHGDSFREEVRQ
jgi:hypothetical protein